MNFYTFLVIVFFNYPFLLIFELLHLTLNIRDVLIDGAYEHQIMFEPVLNPN